MTHAVSIVTVCYNNLAGLTATCQSLMAQDDQSFEWIVIDGGSADGTVEFLKGLELRCQFVSEPDGGIYDAMHKGLRKATGSYVVFLNAGDELARSDCLSLAKSELDGTDVLFFDTRVTGLSRGHVRFARDMRAAKYTVPAIQQSTLYKRSALLRLDWPSAYAVCGDYYIAAQMLKQAWSWKKVAREFSLFQLGGLSTYATVALSREAWRVQRDVLHLSLFVRLVHFARRYLTGTVVRIAFSFRSVPATAT